MSNSINRRTLFKAAALVAGTSVIGKSVAKAAADTATADTARDDSLGRPKSYEWKEPTRPITAIVIGGGNRGNAYSNYAINHAKELKIVGVAEPIEVRNERMAKKYEIPDENRFDTWEDVFDKPKFADVCIITTPDNLHYGPAMAALAKGYHLLLEKAIAQSWEECNEILDLATAKNRIVAVCHVLRYAPYFKQMHHVIHSGQIGEVVSVQHLEPVSNIHMSHSYVRGNWRNTKESNPMLLAKSCHDLDILRWLIGSSCKSVSSYGSLRHFRKEMAPAGAPKRCSDGCPVEHECPYSALKIYLRNKSYLTHLDIPAKTDEHILKALQQGPYGRCVYRCDNDVVDHQVVNMLFENQVTASFSMVGLSSYGGRRTRVFGTKGDIVGDQRFLDVTNFHTGKHVRWDVRKHVKNLWGHGGGDSRLVRDLVQAVSREDSSILTSTLKASMESHLIGFKAEESRLNNKTVEVNIEKS